MMFSMNDSVPFFKGLIGVFWLLLIAESALGQNRPVEYSQVTRPVVEVRDAERISFLLDALIIFSDVEITMLEVVDITGNGFGPDDVVIVHPSMESHYLPPVLPTDVQEMMNGWKLEANTQFDGANADAESYNPETGNSLGESQKAEQAIMYDLLRSLERNYGDGPMSLLFERNDEAFTFQMWDYQEQALSYAPPPPAQPDTVNTYDMLYVLRSDSLVISDTTLFDVVYIKKKVEEVIWMPDIPQNRGDLWTRSSDASKEND